MYAEHSVKTAGLVSEHTDAFGRRRLGVGRKVGTIGLEERDLVRRRPSPVSANSS